MDKRTQSFYDALDRLFKGNKVNDIMKFFEKSLSEAIELDDDNYFISVANEKASYHRVRGEVFEAYDLYLKLLQKLKLLGSSYDLQKAIVLINLGDVDIVAKRYHQAIEKFDLALDLLTAARSSDKRLLASLYNNRSACYRSIKDHEKALDDINKAIDLMANDDKNASRRATSLINLAEILMLKKDLDGAGKVITEALVFFRDHHQGNDIHYANALAVAGNISFETGQFEDAKVFYSEAVKEFQKKTGDSPMLAVLKKNLNEALKRIEG